MKRESNTGRKKLPEYAVWCGMKQRCYYEKSISYPWYGGIGITVSDEWRKSFTQFYKDMGPRPTPRHTIDRIDGSKGYLKENCRWASRYEQSENKVRTHKVLFKGKYMTFREISELTGINQKTIIDRWQKKRPLAGALYSPRGYRKAWNQGIKKDKSKICVICGNTYQYHKLTQETCSRSCANRNRYLKKIGELS